MPDIPVSRIFARPLAEQGGPRGFRSHAPGPTPKRARPPASLWGAPRVARLSRYRPTQIGPQVASGVNTERAFSSGACALRVGSRGCPGPCERPVGVTLPDVQQLSSLGVDEGLRSQLLAGVADAWEARARAAIAGQVRGSAPYAQRRADALRRPVGVALGGCGRTGRLVHCACPGERPRWFGCRQHWLCRRCRLARTGRLSRRLAEALPRALSAAAVPGFRRHHRVVLATFSQRHSGDLSADRKALADGWRRFYLSYVRRYGSFSYAGVWEVTPGSDGRGHVHIHVAVIWPYRDWAVLRRLWLDACPTSSRVSFEASNTPERCARYLAKYLSKGVDGAEFTPELRARVSAAMYANRSVFTSRRFWVPWRPLCPDCCTKVQCRVIPFARVLTANHSMATGPPDADERSGAGVPGQCWWSACGSERRSVVRSDDSDPLARGWLRALW